MSDLRTAAQQALEALKLAIGVLSDEDETESNAVRASIKALKAALERPEQEQVATVVANRGIAIAWHGAVLHLNGREIDPGTIELRTDGYTYRSAVKVNVEPEDNDE